MCRLELKVQDGRLKEDHIYGTNGGRKGHGNQITCDNVNEVRNDENGRADSRAKWQQQVRQQ